MPGKLSVGEINRMDLEEFVSGLGPVFERSPWVAEGAWEKRPFEDLDGLHGALVSVVDDAPEDRRVALIRAHPDLAGKAALAGELTSESASEQASANLDRLSPGEYERFHRLNIAYREKFDFPYVVCVRDNTKETIFAGAEKRLANTREEEIEAALGEISRISRLRLEDLVEKP
ncbi:2-oxo-4-hydroxy-4-carboxy-5-ureidoimidazoline decarboxylase [Rubrobacter tropicus]|uniref:2-oxo-4-hydroxy-4-carboxy-5-ureidoimidazoline decarboxylase n=1 Tax=Rubrobacter tropicus TaxID=2653851 RepID=A0A6G8QBV0_9ACTN|nr:2-oxo-4-hydroxy-4-carboxy-5-ureidoimidazoline decarboxylase [Rubrobacter tropicus]QIN83918.1 2-oxo-4-hydroxy-4-carboxy-5-ureidoimidazoline decarboxylase [Rubrobacter tropicus]